MVAQRYFINGQLPILVYSFLVFEVEKDSEVNLKMDEWVSWWVSGWFELGCWPSAG